MAKKYAPGYSHIEGLDELRRDLRTWDRTAPRLVSLAHRTLAKKVAGKAKSKASSLGSVAAKSAPSIRASGTLKEASVVLGGNKAPYALGAEFGALAYPQFKPWRGSGEDAGYFLYPTIRSMEDEIKDTYLHMVVDALQTRAFPEF